MAWKVPAIEGKPTIIWACPNRALSKKDCLPVAPSLSTSSRHRAGNLIIPNAGPLRLLRSGVTFPVVPKKPGRRKMGVESDSKG